MKEIISKIEKGTARINELFAIVDTEGDGNGNISKDEFKSPS